MALDLLGLLASISARYNVAATKISTLIPALAAVGQATSLLHTIIGVVLGLAGTVGGGLVYYLFGSQDETCKGAPSMCISRRDWVILPVFVTLQFAAVVILALLQAGRKFLKSDDKKKTDVLPISWLVYGLCLGLSFWLGLLLLYDMYVLRAWLAFFVTFVVFCGFSYVHVIHMRTPTT